MFTLRFLSWFSFLALLGAGFHSAAIAQVSPAISVPVIRPLVQMPSLGAMKSAPISTDNVSRCCCPTPR